MSDGTGAPNARNTARAGTEDTIECFMGVVEKVMRTVSDAPGANGTPFFGAGKA
jgi:hypothetical protein